MLTIERARRFAIEYKNMAQHQIILRVDREARCDELNLILTHLFPSKEQRADIERRLKEIKSVLACAPEHFNVGR
jgi:hypothetical protein